MVGTWPRCIWSSCWQVSKCRVPLHSENSFSTYSAYLIFFVTTLLTDISLVLCNHPYRVDIYNSYLVYMRLM